MSDLQQRLQNVVGDSYRVERELGGGGMSRVYLAEEVELGRRVVIKVLPPEMSAEVNKERFQREIKVAASLQHPHVVPLLTAGSAESGELIYYIMPFIDGDSSDPSTLPVPSGPAKDYTDTDPVSDQVFQVFKSLFQSDRLSLEAVVEETDESPEHWTRVRVSFAAGYGNERLTALLFLPKSAEPPYQAMIYMGGSGSFSPGLSSAILRGNGVYLVEYLLRGGRAVLLPLWKGSYDRADGVNVAASGSAAMRECSTSIAGRPASVRYDRNDGAIVDGPRRAIPRRASTR